MSTQSILVLVFSALGVVGSLMALAFRVGRVDQAITSMQRDHAEVKSRFDALTILVTELRIAFARGRLEDDEKTPLPRRMPHAAGV